MGTAAVFGMACEIVILWVDVFSSELHMKKFKTIGHILLTMSDYSVVKEGKLTYF